MENKMDIFPLQSKLDCLTLLFIERPQEQINIKSS